MRIFNSELVDFFQLMSERESAKAAAKIAQMCMQFAEMTKHVQQMAVCADGPLVQEDLDLFLYAFKMTINRLRDSWNKLWLEEIKQKEGANDRLRCLVKEEKTKVEHELVITAKTAVQTARLLMKPDSDFRQTCFLNKMIADFSRYLVDVYIHYPESKRLEKEAIDQADQAYSCALSAPGIDATDELYLGSCVNYSLFQFEILGKPRNACILARDALVNCQENFNLIKDCPQKVTLMQLLRDNLLLWTSIRS